MTWDGCRQVGIGRIGVGMVTVVTLSLKEDVINAELRLKEAIRSAIRLMIHLPDPWNQILGVTCESLPSGPKSKRMRTTIL